MVDERVGERVIARGSARAGRDARQWRVDSGLVSSLAGAHLPRLNAYHADVEGPCSEFGVGAGRRRGKPGYRCACRS